MAHINSSNSRNATDAGIPPTKGLMSLTQSYRVYCMESHEHCPFLKEHCSALGCLQYCPIPSCTIVKHKRNLCGNRIFWIHLLLLFLLFLAHLFPFMSSKTYTVPQSSAHDFGLRLMKVPQAIARAPSCTSPRGLQWCEISLTEVGDSKL